MGCHDEITSEEGIVTFILKMLERLSVDTLLSCFSNLND